MFAPRSRVTFGKAESHLPGRGETVSLSGRVGAKKNTDYSIFSESGLP